MKGKAKMSRIRIRRGRARRHQSPVIMMIAVIAVLICMALFGVIGLILPGDGQKYTSGYVIQCILQIVIPLIVVIFLIKIVKKELKRILDAAKRTEKSEGSSIESDKVEERVNFSKEEERHSVVLSKYEDTDKKEKE